MIETIKIIVNLIKLIEFCSIISNIDPSKIMNRTKDDCVRV